MAIKMATIALLGLEAAMRGKHSLIMPLGDIEGNGPRGGWCSHVACKLSLRKQVRTTSSFAASL